MNDPAFLDYDYIRIYEEVVSWQMNHRSSVDALFIGGGGYTFPRYMEAKYAGARIDVVEIDPEVTRVVYEYLGLSRTTSIRSFNEDSSSPRMKLLTSVRSDRPCPPPVEPTASADEGVDQRLKVTTAVFRGRLFRLSCESPAVFSPSCTVGVGQNPDSVPTMRGTNVGSGDTMPLRIIPERMEVAENSVKSTLPEVRDVLRDDPTHYRHNNSKSFD